MQIPKVVHRYWDGGPMPGQYHHFADRLRELNPDWKVVDWSGPPVGLHNRAEFDAAGRPQMRSDVARYEILLSEGGVYLDCDVEPLRPFGNLLDGVLCFAGWETDRTLGTAVIGATRRHPAAWELVRGLPGSVRDSPGLGSEFSTGPGFITRVWGDRPGLRRFERPVFYPYAHEQWDLSVGPFPDSVLVHHWHNLISPGERCGLLALFPPGSSGVEVGVLEGAFAREIVRLASPARLTLVDPWARQDGSAYDDPLNCSQPEQDARHDAVVAHFAAEPSVQVLRRYSLDAAAEFADASLDWVYVDANHTYNSAAADLSAWADKVRVGGYLCGHDYLDSATCGVKRAVDEFVLGRQGAFRWSCLTRDPWPSFALRRLR